MIWRGVVFRDYESTGLEKFEVCVSEGVITCNFDTLPDELTEWQAGIVAEMLKAARQALPSPTLVPAGSVEVSPGLWLTPQGYAP